MLDLPVTAEDIRDPDDPHDCGSPTTVIDWYVSSGSFSLLGIVPELTMPLECVEYTVNTIELKRK